VLYIKKMILNIKRTEEVREEAKMNKIRKEDAYMYCQSKGNFVAGKEWETREDTKKDKEEIRGVSSESSDDESDSFMFSKVRFYGGGPGLRETDEQQEEEMDGQRKMTPEKRAQCQMKLKRILEDGRKFVKHLTDVYLGKSCAGRLVSQCKRKNTQQSNVKAEKEIILHGHGAVGILEQFLSVNKQNGFKIADKNFSEILQDLEDLGENVSNHRHEWALNH